MRATAVEILGSLGYRVLEAANGHQALEQFMQHPDIALVFSDVMLPGGLLGTQLVTKLRERRPGSEGAADDGIQRERDHASRHARWFDGSAAANRIKVEDLARRVRAILDETRGDATCPGVSGIWYWQSTMKSTFSN